MFDAIEKQEAPTQDYFDAALLRSRNIQTIAGRRYVVIGRGESFYYQKYDQGRPMGGVGFSKANIPFTGCESVEVGEDSDGIDPVHLQELIAGERIFDAKSIDQVARQHLTLEQAMSDQLFVFATNDKPGHKRLYFMRKGRLMMQNPVFVKVKSGEIEAGLWMFAFNQTGSPEYSIVDLTKKNKLF